MSTDKELRRAIVKCFDTERMDEDDVANVSDFEEHDIEFFDTSKVIDNLAQLFNSEALALLERLLETSFEQGNTSYIFTSKVKAEKERYS